MSETKSPGQTGYEAYGDAAGWLTFDRKAMPSWQDLGACPLGLEHRRRWEAAAVAILGAARRDTDEASNRVTSAPTEGW